MKFGLILPITATGVPLDQLLDELREEVRAADEAGFDAFFLPEFHSARGGALISPQLLGAALVEGTKRIRVGQAVLATPLHHPIRLVEDIVMLSWLTRGRALVGVGAAHQIPDFELYGIDRKTRFRRLREFFDIADAAWSGEEFDLHGYRGRVAPLPYGGRPEVWMGAHGPKGLQLAAERADVWLADPQRDVATVARLAVDYRRHAEAAGRRPRIALFREGWIADTREECEAVWVPHAMAVHRLYFNVKTYLPEFEPWVSQVKSREDFTPDLVAPGRFLYGNGEDIRAEVKEWQRITGCEYIALRMRHPGGPGHEAALEAIRRFGREVIAPLAKERSAAGAEEER